MSPDFFSYFTATAPLLYRDPSLLCVSAFNDNGQSKYAGDPSALHRSDFFPGLGWLLSRRLWSELEGRWPNERGFWDDWLREPEQRKGRSSIRPEVSRTFTFGVSGTSTGQFYAKYLGKIALNPSAVDWRAHDLSYLLRPNYEERFRSWLAAAPAVSMSQAMAEPGHGGEAGDVRVLYESKAALVSYCKRLGLMEDLKAGVPRTAYHGVVLVRIGGRRVFLAPSYHVDQDITKPVS